MISNITREKYRESSLYFSTDVLMLEVTFSQVNYQASPCYPSQL